MLISLYTTRLLLEVLGVDDLGIYNVVASIVMMFDFVSSSLINANQRYLNIAIGKEDDVLLNKYFSQGFILNFSLAFFIVCVLETIGLYILKSSISVPLQRLDATTTVFQLSVITVFFRIITISFQSIIISRENMKIYAYLSIFEAIAKLLIMFLLLHNSNYDNLVYYSFLLLAIQIILFIVYAIYCNVVYKESRFRYYFDKSLARDMSSFIGINTFGYLSWAAGNYGINIILNVFFGPAVNGAKALASTVERLLNQIVNNVFQAVNPQITKSYAKNDIKHMIELAEKSTLFMFYLLLIVGIPLYINLQFILEIWLKSVPTYTLEYTRLMVIQSFFWMLPIPFNQIANSTGKIKNIQLYGRIISLLALPLSYILLKIFPNPFIPSCILIIVNFLYWMFIIWDVTKKLEIAISDYFKNVVVYIVKVTIVLVLLIYSVNSMLNISDILRLLVVTILSVGLGFIIVFFIGLPKVDREYVTVYLKKKILK